MTDSMGTLLTDSKSGLSLILILLFLFNYKKGTIKVESQPVWTSRRGRSSYHSEIWWRSRCWCIAPLFCRSIHADSFFLCLAPRSWSTHSLTPIFRIPCARLLQISSAAVQSSKRNHLFQVFCFYLQRLLGTSHKPFSFGSLLWYATKFSAAELGINYLEAEAIVPDGFFGDLGWVHLRVYYGQKLLHVVL